LILSQIYMDVVICLYGSDGRIRDFGANLTDSFMVELHCVYEYSH